MEQECLSLEPYEAEELRVEIKGALKCSYNPRSNVTKEMKAFKELRQNETGIILTADSGVALVVLEKREYINKVEKLPEGKHIRKLCQIQPTNIRTN